MPTILGTDGYLVVNGVALSTPAYWITNLAAEMESDSAVRGDDRIIPGAAGVRAKRRRRTVTVKQFQLIVIGGVDNSGSTNANELTGLITNLEYLKANLGLAYATGDGTVTAVWHRPDSSTKTAAVHVVAFVVAPIQQRYASVVLELSIPTGIFS